MKFVTFRHAGMERAGVLHGDGSGLDGSVFDLGSACMREALGVEPQLLDFLDRGLDRVALAIARHGLREDARLALHDVELAAPFRPRRIFGVAHNYRCACEERGIPAPDAPVLFVKEPYTVIGPGEAVVLPPGVGGVTYEAELAAVIGRRCEGVGVAEALHYIAAYAVFNDISASEIIRKERRLEPGKNFPTFGPFGPYLATADEIVDSQALGVRLLMDDLCLQEGDTCDMLFGVAQLVSVLSQRMALQPGDVIATGTPAGVAAMRKPPTWLRPGSTLSASVAGLGTLINSVVEGTQPDA